MGKQLSSTREEARYVSAGTFTATGGGTPLSPVPGKFNVSVWGTFSATCALERSFDGGTTWINCTKPDGSSNSFTTPMTLVCEEPENGVLYRINCSSFTSGTVNYRISQ